jgi:hypothetical protein
MFQRRPNVLQVHGLFLGNCRSNFVLFSKKNHTPWLTTFEKLFFLFTFLKQCVDALPI